MSNLVAPPPDDKRLWKILLATVHPDRGGSEDLFTWVTKVRESLCTCTQQEQQCSKGTYSERIPYSEELAYIDDHIELTRRALSIGQRQPEPYKSVLRLLIDHISVEHGRGNLKQSRGASYKQLAYVCHLAGMSKIERSGFYELARAVPLSESHAAHLISRLKESKPVLNVAASYQ